MEDEKQYMKIKQDIPENWSERRESLILLLMSL